MKKVMVSLLLFIGGSLYSSQSASSTLSYSAPRSSSSGITPISVQLENESGTLLPFYALENGQLVAISKTQANLIGQTIIYIMIYKVGG